MSSRPFSVVFYAWPLASMAMSFAWCTRKLSMQAFPCRALLLNRRQAHRLLELEMVLEPGRVLAHVTPEDFMRLLARELA